MGMMIHRRKEGHLFPKTKAEIKAETKETPVEIKETVKVDDKKEKEAVYSLEEINKLPFFTLKSVAANNGVDVKGKKGSEIKAELIKKLGL